MHDASLSAYEYVDVSLCCKKGYAEGFMWNNVLDLSRFVGMVREASRKKEFGTAARAPQDASIHFHRRAG